VLDGLKGANLLPLDSGNALFRNAGNATADDRARAHFILDVMGRLGVRAMAVGARDVSAGLEFLQKEAKGSPVKLLSANLRRGGAPVFDASVILDVGGLKVAVVGVSAPGPLVPNAPDVVAEPTVPAVKAAVAKLGKRDVTLVLAASSYADAMQLAVALDGQVDVVLQSGEFRGIQPPQLIDGTGVYLLASGQRGQALGKLRLELGGGGKGFFDLSNAERDRQQLDFIESQLATVDTRIKATKDPGLVGDLKKVRDQMRERQAALKRAVGAPALKGARTIKLDWAVLGADVKDDPALKQEVLKFEPTYAGAH
jgi:2',3'-cyclic-nucleotide 2'-phosphodiesterase (5'-nucleotidase family)